MNRELFQNALDGYHALANGAMEGNPDHIQKTREMLMTLGTSTDPTVIENLLRANQAAFRKYAEGPLDDLLDGLNAVRRLAEEYLALEDQSEHP